MTQLPPIPGGYVLLARVSLESRAWSLGPDAGRLMEWLLLKARYSAEPKKMPGFDLGRGELVTSLAKMAEGCAWFENRLEREWSRQKTMRLLNQLIGVGFCERISDTYGTHLRVCNYERYQTAALYNSDSHGTDVEQLWNSCGTDADTYKKGKKEKNDKKEETPAPAPASRPPSPRAKPIPADVVEEIRQAYPRMIGKRAAIPAIRRAIKAGAEADHLLERVQAFAIATKGANMRYIPHPATWFNKGHYDDDPAEWATMGREEPRQPQLFDNDRRGLAHGQIFVDDQELTIEEA